MGSSREITVIGNHTIELFHREDGDYGVKVDTTWSWIGMHLDRAFEVYYEIIGRIYVGVWPWPACSYCKDVKNEMLFCHECGKDEV